jgi:hypothetical protein
MMEPRWLRVSMVRKEGTSPTCLGVLYYQVARRADHGNQRGREEHFNDSDIPFVAVKDLGEGIGVVDAEALGGANSQTAVVLVEGDEVEGAAQHDGWTPSVRVHCAVCLYVGGESRRWRVYGE